MSSKPYQILITNDDGIGSPGLLAAAEALSTLGEVTVVAPRVQQTSKGRSFSRRITSPRNTIKRGLMK